MIDEVQRLVLSVKTTIQAYRLIFNTRGKRVLRDLEMSRKAEYLVLNSLLETFQDHK